MQRAILAAITAILFIIPVVAVAGEAPDLTGTWTGKSVGIKHGKTDAKAHKDEADLGKVSSLDMTLTIKSQDGRVFTGTHGSPKFSERILGVVSVDNKSLYLVDEDNHYFGKILGPDKLEMVYMEVDHPTQGVAHAIYTKQK